MYDALLAETVTITGHGGDGSRRTPPARSAPGPRGGVVVIHHMPGYDGATKEIARQVRGARLRGRLPEPLLPRGARRRPRTTPRPPARANGGVPDERLVGDVARRGGVPAGAARRPTARSA